MQERHFAQRLPSLKAIAAAEQIFRDRFVVRHTRIERNVVDAAFVKASFQVLAELANILAIFLADIVCIDTERLACFWIA